MRVCVCVCIDFFLAIYYLYPFDHKLIIPSPSCSSSNWIVNDNETCENSTESIELIKNDNVLSILLNLMKTFFKIYLLTLFSFVICFKDIFHKTIEHELYADLIHHTESNTHSLSFNKKKKFSFIREKFMLMSFAVSKIMKTDYSTFFSFFSSSLFMSLQPPNKRRRIEKKEDNLNTLKNKFYQLLPDAPFIISRLIVNLKLLVLLIILF